MLAVKWDDFGLTNTLTYPENTESLEAYGIKTIQKDSKKWNTDRLENQGINVDSEGNGVVQKLRFAF